jgi:hypothetical protein
VHVCTASTPWCQTPHVFTVSTPWCNTPMYAQCRRPGAIHPPVERFPLQHHSRVRFVLLGIQIRMFATRLAVMYRILIPEMSILSTIIGLCGPRIESPQGCAHASSLKPIGRSLSQLTCTIGVQSSFDSQTQGPYASGCIPYRFTGRCIGTLYRLTGRCQGTLYSEDFFLVFFI